MKTIKQAYQEELQYIRDRRSGRIKSFKTPWERLNDAGIDGLEWGTISTIAAMSGMGKTAVVNQLVTEMRQYNPAEELSVLFFTMEMDPSRLVGRSLSNIANRTLTDIYKNITVKELQTLHNTFSSGMLNEDIVYHEFYKTPEEIRNTVNGFASTRTNKKMIVVFDHILLTKREPSKTERETLIQLLSTFNELKKVYKRNMLFIILSQLNRKIEDPIRRMKPQLHFPTKADLFGSDASYQFSDIVFVIHDPYKTGLMTYGTKKLTTQGFIFGHLLKVREGPPNQMIIFHNKLMYNKIKELSIAELKNHHFV